MYIVNNKVSPIGAWLDAFLPPSATSPGEARLPALATGAVVNTFLTLSGVWLSAAGLSSGMAAAWALWRDENVSTAAADGAAIGFIYGIPVTACAAIMLLLGI